MSIFKWLTSFILCSTILPAHSAESHCPGNVASLPVHPVNRYLFIVAVSINHSGPYNFLVDTGTQVTTVDPSLAAELHLNSQGPEMITGVGFHASASSARVDLIESGPRAVSNQKVLVYDLQNLQSAGLKFRGVLGEDFLQHFDLLIDYAHGLLCLDDSGTMRTKVKGPHIALVTPVQPAEGVRLPRSLIVEAWLSDGTRPVRLWLDSGTNVAFLYNPSDCMAQKLFRGKLQQGFGADAGKQTLSTLPAQDVKIGSLELQKVSFLTTADARENSQIAEFDGLLTTWLFRRVFIDHADHFAVLEVW